MLDVTKRYSQTHESTLLQARGGKKTQGSGELTLSHLERSDWVPRRERFPSQSFLQSSTGHRGLFGPLSGIASTLAAWLVCQFFYKINKTRQRTSLPHKPYLWCYFLIENIKATFCELNQCWYLQWSSWVCDSHSFAYRLAASSKHLCCCNKGIRERGRVGK